MNQPEQSSRWRSRGLRRLSRYCPGFFRMLMKASLKGYLPLGLYRHWFFQSIEGELWPQTRPWTGRKVPLLKTLRIEVDPGDFVGSEILKQGCYEPETVRFLCENLKAGMTFIDVGANIGQYSLIASRLVSSAGKVHCFEPNPVVYSVLVRNVKLNHCRNVTTHQTAIGNGAGREKLFLSNHRVLGTTSLVPAGSYYSGRHVDVDVTTIDEYVRATSLSHVDVIKIDVEGAELGVLQGAVRTMNENERVLIVLEFNNTTLARFGISNLDLERFLRDQGFNLFFPDARPLPNLQGVTEEYFNVVASRSSTFAPASSFRDLQVPANG